MKKRVILVLLFLILPVFIYAASIVSTYSETVTKANNYINSFKDRRKYLIFNRKYVFENGVLSGSELFKTGGLLSKSEFELSIDNEQSYLATGKEYWTLTSNGSNSKYYIDAYLDSKSQTSKSGTRVTEYVKPGTIITGKGTYSNPWTFMEGYSVDVISNNTSFGTVSPLGAQYVIPGSSLDYVLTPAKGYFYNSNKDNCDLIKKGANIYENDYIMENINRDITCTAVFELRTYKFELRIDSRVLDYVDELKDYDTEPSPSSIYFKYKKNWYSDPSTRNVLENLERKPQITGWTFTGYYYGNVKVIDENGHILLTDLDLGSTNDFVDINHVLYARFTRNPYTISYELNGGDAWTSTTCPTASYTFNSTSKACSKSVTYDGTYGSMPTPERTGYTFLGWYTAASNGTKIETSTTVAITSAQTLYAHWSAKSNTVTFNVNGGDAWTSTTCPTASYTFNSTLKACSKSVTYDGTYGSMPTPERTGYTFLGWYTAASNGTKIETSTTVAITSAQTLYAHWSIDSHTLTINPNGGKWNDKTTNSTVTQNYNTTYTVSAPSASYAVTYNANSQGATYSDGSTTAARSYSWELTGGGSFNSNTKVYTFGTSNGTLKATYGKGTFTLQGITKTGHDCKWLEGSTTGTECSGGSTRTISAATTYYAKCSKNQYQLTINPNGGKWNDKTTNSTVTQEYESTYTVAAPVATYSVTYNANSQGATYTASPTTATRSYTWSLTGSGSFNSNTKVYTFGAGVGTLTASYGDATFNLPAISKANHTCKWAEGSATGTQYDGGASRTISANKTYYAVCKSNSYFTFSYPSGKYSVVEGTSEVKDGKVLITSSPWKIEFKESGTLTVYDLGGNIDVFAVGGGGGGGSVYCATNIYTASGGGGGGYTTTYKNISMPSSSSGTQYIVTIGAGGSGGIPVTQAVAPDGADGSATSVVINGTTISAAGGKGGGARYTPGCRSCTQGGFGGAGGSGGGAGKVGAGSCADETHCGDAGTNGGNGVAGGWRAVTDSSHCPNCKITSGRPGGTGGNSSGLNKITVNGSTSACTNTREFCESSGKIYSDGGAGGGGGTGSLCQVGGAKGSSGGGKGGSYGYAGVAIYTWQSNQYKLFTPTAFTWNADTAMNGVANTGGGGGGASDCTHDCSKASGGYCKTCTYRTKQSSVEYAVFQGGNGGSGILIIRNAR